jgi:hypothetical protein
MDKKTGLNNFHSVPLFYLSAVLDLLVCARPIPN